MAARRGWQSLALALPDQADGARVSNWRRGCAALAAGAVPLARAHGAAGLREHLLEVLPMALALELIDLLVDLRLGPIIPSATAAHGQALHLAAHRGNLHKASREQNDCIHQ